MQVTVIIHGEKPLSSCMMHPAFRERLEEAVRVCARVQETGAAIAAVVITGGETRRGCQSEAASGAAFLASRVSVPVLREEYARTTSENVRRVKSLMQARSVAPTAYLIMTSKTRLFRVRYLYRRLWPEGFLRAQFVGAKDGYPCWYTLLERLYFLYDLIDPRERTLPRLTKKFFRNNNAAVPRCPL